MAVNVSFAGNTYSLPNVAGENGWATLTDFLVAVASNSATQASLRQAIRVATSSPVTVTANDFTVITDMTVAGAVSVQLSAGVTKQVVIIADGKGDAATNNITITGNGGQLINGSASYVINANLAGVMLQFDGTQWRVLLASKLAGSITNADIASNAGIVFSKLQSLPNGSVLLGNGSNVAAAYTVDGDVLIGPGGISSIQPNVIVNGDISPAAAILRSKLATGTPSHAVIHDGSGNLSSEAQLAGTRGGTGTSNAGTLTFGANPLTLTTTASTNVTLPTSGTLATLAGTESPTNKTFNDTSNVVLKGGNAVSVLSLGVTGSGTVNVQTDSITRLAIFSGADAAVSGDAQFTGSSGLFVPTGNTAQRPSTPSTGTLRHNTSTGVFEGRYSGVWRALATHDGTETLTNKTIAAGSNTITALSDTNVASNAAIARSKLGTGTASHVVINDASGFFSSEAQLAGTRGGTGVSSTATFPTSGVIPTESSTSTLLNKRVSSTAAMTGALELPAGTAAQRPTAVAGHIRLNTDSNEFEGYANGAWQSVGGGLNERPEKNYLKTYATAAVAPGSCTLVASTGNIATTAGLFHAGLNESASAIGQSSDTSLRGSFNYLTALSTASGSGAAYVQFPVFALEGTDLGKPVFVSFDVSGNAADGNWDVVMIRYNSAGTYQEQIPIAGSASSGATVGSAKLPTGRTTFRSFFIAGATATDLYSLRFRRFADTSSHIRIDSIYVGPQSFGVGAPVTDWQSYTPTVSNLGTGSTSLNSAYWRRVGDSVELQFLFQKDASAGSGASVVEWSLPSNFVIDTTKTTGGAGVGLSNIGSAFVYTTSYSSSVFAPRVQTTTTLSVTNPTGTNGVTGANIVASQYIIFSAKVPIVNWASNVTLTDRSVEEYVSHDGTSVVYGVNGAALLTTTPAGTSEEFTITPQQVVNSTDHPFIEVSNGNVGRWSPLNGIVAEQLRFDGTNYIGIGVYHNGTDWRLIRGKYRNGTTGAWSGLTANSRIRVSFVKGGAAAGFPVGARNVIGDVTGTSVPTGYIGEVVTTTVGPASFSSGVQGNIGSTTLAAGVWEVVGFTRFTPSGSTGNTFAAWSMSTTSASLSAQATEMGTGGTTNVGGPTPPLRVVSTGSTVVYLVGQYNFTSAGSSQFFNISQIRAVRIA